MYKGKHELENEETANGRSREWKKPRMEEATNGRSNERKETGKKF